MKNEDLERVSENFLNPMMELYSKKLNQYQVQAYVEDLCQFSNDVLLGAVLQLRRSGQYFPKISECITACEKVQARVKKPTDHKISEVINDLDEARKMAKEYTDRFMTTPTGNEAERNKYSFQLFRYVFAAAMLQAQMILGMKNLGWSSMDLFGDTTPSTDEVKVFFAKSREQANQNYIDVAIPASKFQEWKGQNQQALAL